MMVPLIGFVVSWSFPFYLNIWKAKELDGYLKSKVGIEPSTTSSVEDGSRSSGVDEKGRLSHLIPTRSET